jgi:catechol-2,3-dioxygenase
MKNDTNAEINQHDSNEDWIIRPTLHHYGLTTANLKAMSEWYATVLGMSVVFEKTGRILNCSQPHFC